MTFFCHPVPPKKCRNHLLSMMSSQPPLWWVSPCAWSVFTQQRPQAVRGVMPSPHTLEEAHGETRSPLLETPKLRSQDTLNSHFFAWTFWLVAKFETLKNVMCIFELELSLILNSDLALFKCSQGKAAILFAYRAGPPCFYELICICSFPLSLCSEDFNC